MTLRLAVLGESEFDDVLIRGVVDAIRGTKCVPVSTPLRRRDGGWPAVLEAVPGVMSGIWYRDLADAFVVVCDADDGPIAADEVADPSDIRRGHRLTILRERIASVRAELRPVDGRGPLYTAVGMAVPAIEAWCLVGLHPDASEARTRQHASRRDLRRELKDALCGTSGSTSAARKSAALAAVDRIAADPSMLDRNFPVGFGELRRNVAAWGVQRDR